MMVASRFDMSSFIEQEHFAKAANNAKPDDLAALATLAGFGGERLISKLSAMPCQVPAMMALWPALVDDAVWLHESGKAAEAFDAGWSEIELFGWSASSWQSLTVWLNGARSLVVGKAFDGPVHTRWACKRRFGERRLFIRNAAAELPDDMVLLWDL